MKKQTALFFHNLTDRKPIRYSVTVRTGYNPSRLQKNGVHVYTVKKELHRVGVATAIKRGTLEQMKDAAAVFDEMGRKSGHAKALAVLPEELFLCG